MQGIEAAFTLTELLKESRIGAGTNNCHDADCHHLLPMDIVHGRRQSCAGGMGVFIEVHIAG